MTQHVALKRWVAATSIELYVFAIPDDVHIDLGDMDFDPWDYPIVTEDDEYIDVTDSGSWEDASNEIGADFVPTPDARSFAAGRLEALREIADIFNNYTTADGWDIELMEAVDRHLNRNGITLIDCDEIEPD